MTEGNGNPLQDVDSLAAFEKTLNEFHNKRYFGTLNSKDVDNLYVNTIEAFNGGVIDVNKAQYILLEAASVKPSGSSKPLKAQEELMKKLANPYEDMNMFNVSFGVLTVPVPQTPENQDISQFNTKLTLAVACLHEVAANELLPKGIVKNCLKALATGKVSDQEKRNAYKKVFQDYRDGFEKFGIEVPEVNVQGVKYTFGEKIHI